MKIWMVHEPLLPYVQPRTFVVGRAQTDESRGLEENRLDHGLGDTKVLTVKAIY